MSCSTTALADNRLADSSDRRCPVTEDTSIFVFMLIFAGSDVQRGRNVDIHAHILILKLGVDQRVDQAR